MTLPLDRININRLTARTYVGFNEWEKEKQQEVAVSVTLHADLSAACRSDDVADTVDYKQLKKQILSRVEGGRFLLIEKMAEDIALICLAHPLAVRVDVTVDKLSALRFARSVSVEITREKGDGHV
jgi:FolB domain-containing protein